ncbi:MAG: protein jag [Spirochaetaceae bacterium]|jgi:spoIIIJ-associated protein|nr:protein jag [Spirochaetaceae bacterium]
MIYEFEGRTEKEAIDRAAMELGIEKDEFDVEILETQRSGLFKKGFVKIQVHTGDSSEGKTSLAKAETPAPRTGKRSGSAGSSAGESSGTFEKNMVSFVEGLIERMGYGGTVSVLYREERKLGLKIESEYSSILIGKKGKNLDALQLLANVYAGRQGREDLRIILDSENYRIRREESLVRLAYTVADKVRETKSSVLLEPMNPFDRRLIHTTLNDITDVETKSEGEGLYKQVRIYYRGLR